jgi:hypothetical protein
MNAMIVPMSVNRMQTKGYMLEQRSVATSHSRDRCCRVFMDYFVIRTYKIFDICSTSIIIAQRVLRNHTASVSLLHHQPRSTRPNFHWPHNTLPFTSYSSLTHTPGPPQPLKPSSLSPPPPPIPKPTPQPPAPSTPHSHKPQYPSPSCDGSAAPSACTPHIPSSRGGTSSPKSQVWRKVSWPRGFVRFAASQGGGRRC